MNRAETINDFASIADVYDELVNWAPYAQWVEALHELLQKFGLPDDAWLLDVACGTGLSVLPWLERGCHVMGADVCRPMLDVARARLRDAGRDVVLLEQDMLALAPDRTFDAAICMHAGLDYLLDERDLAAAFVSMRGCLEPGGLLAFDKCLDEPAFYRADYGNRRRISCGAVEFLYHWDRDAAMLVQHCVVTRRDRKPHARTEFTYHLKATRPERLEEMTRAAGFETLRRPRQFEVSDPGFGVYRAV
jgi:ubiquinone/menaquinone biosynthesis C-methylase UbiE